MMQKKETAKLIAVDAFINNHKFFLENEEIVFEKDLAQLFEISVAEIKKVVKKEHLRFPEDFLIKIKDPENGDERLAFTLAGIFMLAGQVKTKRGKEISLQMVEFLIDRKPNALFDVLMDAKGE